MNNPHTRGAKSPVPPEIALANDVFDQFCSAAAMKTILGHYRHLCDLLSIKPTNYPQFYPKLKSKLKTWKAQALWNKFDKRASHKCYNRGKTCSNNRVLIIGAGPCGLRAAIEAQLLGAKVVVLEKRDRFSRNNVLHLWPFVIHDLKSLGAKKFFGKFCAGSIDHISIRQLQCILMKVALILGVEIHEGVGFESILPPPSNQDEEKIGWRAVVSPPDHPVSQYEFNVLIGADGKRNTLEGFKRKEFRGKLAIAITANFINKKTEAEARVEEISGVAFIFNQKFFKDLYAETGIDLENIVYYKDDTHYFVMTAKKQSLLDKGVILNDYADTARLLSQDNIDKDCLKQYARQAADFSTDYNLPHMEFAVNHYGQSDVAMFDFTSMYAAENACRFIERNGHKLLMTLVGDSLLEPFWPTGSGCARGFLSSMDACWAVRSWASGILNPLEVLAERESIYRILGQTTPENLHRDHASYSLDPTTRYPNLNQRVVLPVQVKGLYDTDDPSTLEMYLKAPSTLLSPGAADQPKKRRRREAQVHPDILLFWLKQQVTLYDTVHITDLTSSFKDGLALCAIIHRYRPDLIDFHTLNAEEVKENNQRAFDILEKELGIPSVMTGVEMEEIDLPDEVLMESYLGQIYETFRREIPHIQHPRLPKEDILAEEPVRRDHLLEKVKTLHRLSNEQKCSLLRLTTSPAPGPPTRKRHSSGTGGAGDKRCALSPLDNNPGSNSSLSKKTRKRRSGAAPGTVAARKTSIEQIEVTRSERLSKQREQRDRDTRQFVKSMQMLAAYSRPEPGSEPPITTNVDEDYGIFMYRQNAPDFKLRVKDIERKINHPAREVRSHMGIKTGGLEEDISGRVRNLEEKFRAVPTPGMKPKDLYRAIGKIEKTDWNVKEIEKKIEENKYGKTSKPHSERVPKWSHQQFVDKFSAVERKLRKKGLDEATASKYAQIDQSLKQLEQKIKEGNVLEQGQRGSNKVSAMAAQLVTKTQDDKVNNSKPGSKPVPSVPVQSGSELCHFCNKRVYLMEMMNAEGRYFHRGCFRCEYCSINLRLGNYAFDREGKYGHRFFCTQHFGLPGTMKMRARRKNDFLSPAAAPHTPTTPSSGSSLKNSEPDASTPICSKTSDAISKPGSLAISPVIPKTPEVNVLVRQDQMERDGTPERIEIEVDGDEVPSVMDEDEWTDRNFGTSCAENNSEESCDESSDEDDEEEYSEALDVPLNVDETLRLAKDWTRKYGQQQNGDDSDDQDEDEGSEEEMSGSEEDEELFSYQESDSEDDVSTATEGEEEIKAREARKQEVFLKVPDRALPTDSDTEVGTEYTTTSSSETEEENSATEISTDSEFERDETTPKHEVPDIVIGETVQTKRTTLETPQRVQYNGKPTVELQLKPLVSSDFKVPARPLPLINPNKGDYNLNKTQSTEGIASKLSLELKKKYLFGAQDSGSKVMKSGSTSMLDTKFKSFVNQINEAQKLLNPAPEPSVTMQAFLQGADRIKTPLIPPLPLIPAPGVKEFVNAKEFPHVCPLGESLDRNTPHVCPVENVPDSTKPSAVPSNDKPDNNVITTLPDSSIPNTSDINVNVKPTDVPLEDKSETITKVCDKTNDIEKSDVIEENEARPRSPVHETSIIVPDVDLKKSVFNEKTNNWEAIEKKPASSSEDEMDVEETKSQQEAEEEAEAAAESDCTLSSDDVSTLSSYDENSKANKVHMSPPKLEIHNSKGELLLEENCNHTEVVDLVQSNLIKNSADRMNTSMPDVCQVPLTKPSTSPDDKTGSKSVENLTSNNSFNAKIISVPSDETSGSVLKQVNHTSELFAGPEVKSNGRDSPASPVSESMNTGALTETELSDWAREEEPMSEILDDSDFKHINTKNITFRRHQKPKTQKKSLNLRGVAAKIAKSEEFDEFPHVCGKSPTTPTHAHPYPIAPSSSLVLTNVDNIEFMDTGNEDSSTEEVEVNTGYVQFVNTNTDDDSELSTPLAPEPSVPYKLLEINHNDEDEHSHVTTTTSDQVTVKSNNPMPELNDNQTSDSMKTKTNTTDAKINTSEVLTKSNHILELSSTPPVVEARNEAVIYAMTNAQAMADPTSQAYQDYVQRFQGRVSPFSNARDSIDIRKSRKHSRSSMSEVVAKESLKEDEKENLPSPTGVKPSTSKKLEELSRERTKQKDLIHEMVMNKLIAEGKSPNDRKSKRSSRGSFSPLGLSGAQNALNHPILKQNEHLRTCPITNNFNNYEQTRVNQNHKISPDHNSHNKTSLEQYSHNKTSPDYSHISPDQHKSSLMSPDPVNSNDEITPTNERQGVFTSLDVYCTPMTSLRSVRARPVSIHSPPSQYSTPCPLSSSPYSLPDIPQALAVSQDDVFTTPRRPPRTKPDFQELRNSARARAKLLSDSQLGLSPEEKLKLLKQKIAQRRLVHSETDSYHSPESNSRPFTLNTTSPLAVTSSQKTTVDKSPSHSPTSPPASSSVDQQQPLSSSNRKKNKDRERRKSLIQAVSEFFHKKSPSPPSPSSSHVIIPPPTSSTNSMSKFKFPRIHHKHKDKTSSPPFCDQTNMKPSLSESEIRRHLIDSLAPPIPPPPLNYRPSHLKMPSEDSLTDLDDFHSHLEDSLVYQDTEELTVTSSNVSTLSKKQSRHYRRLARQAQHKRLRMAQEIQRQLEELEVKQRELEARGVEVEKLVRGEDTDVLCGDESTLLQRWYDLMRERSELRRLERELSVRAQEIDLEERHARLQHELKERMDREENKTEEDVAIEGRIIQEMLDIVQQRNNLVSLLETDRQRYKEEDQDLEAQILTLKQTHH